MGVLCACGLWPAMSARVRPVQRTATPRVKKPQTLFDYLAHAGGARRGSRSGVGFRRPVADRSGFRVASRTNDERRLPRSPAAPLPRSAPRRGPRGRVSAVAHTGTRTADTLEGSQVRSHEGLNEGSGSSAVPHRAARGGPRRHRPYMYMCMYTGPRGSQAGAVSRSRRPGAALSRSRPCARATRARVGAVRAGRRAAAPPGPARRSRSFPTGRIYDLVARVGGRLFPDPNRCGSHAEPPLCDSR